MIPLFLFAQKKRGGCVLVERREKNTDGENQYQKNASIDVA